MTFSAGFTITDVGDGPAPIDVMAEAAVSDGSLARSGDDDGPPIRSAVLTLQLEADETDLAVGDTINVSGHFIHVP